MASLKAFNGLMQQFIDELARVFPQESKLQFYSQQFPLLCEANPRKPMELFVATYTPHFPKIQARDPSVFQEVPKFFNEIDILTLWGKCNEATREAIWKYLQHLSFMATTVSLIPPEMLSAIESVAMDCADKYNKGEFNPNQLMSMLPQLMQTMSTPPK